MSKVLGKRSSSCVTTRTLSYVPLPLLGIHAIRFTVLSCTKTMSRSRSRSRSATATFLVYLAPADPTIVFDVNEPWPSLE